MAEQDNMQNGENSNRSTSGNGMHTWEMQGNVQGNGTRRRRWSARTC